MTMRILTTASAPRKTIGLLGIAANFTVIDDPLRAEQAVKIVSFDSPHYVGLADLAAAASRHTSQIVSVEETISWIRKMRDHTPHKIADASELIMGEMIPLTPHPDTFRRGRSHLANFIQPTNQRRSPLTSSFPFSLPHQTPPPIMSQPHTNRDQIPAPTLPEVQAAREQLMRCSPELTLPYNDRKKPRVITVPQLNGIKRAIR